jgi:Zn-dependent protease with chaperone function/type II secretory pathway pseudopilin PulG
MDELVYPRERTLGTITLVLGLVVWLGLVIGTFGAALVGLALGFLLYLFVQSTLIAHIKGNGVELSQTQFPDLYAHFSACCERLQISKPPQAYVLNGNGGLNAFATKFLGTQYVVLLSGVVDAMEQHPDGVRFYIGHELGHLRMKHLSGHLLRWPALWLPLIGAAYARARESTCDRHGLACSSSPAAAAQALAALSAGAGRWRLIDLPAYVAQTRHSTGFWMSFHELTAGYPWLSKRAARVMQTGAPMPARHGLAYVLAAFVPYAGRLGAGFGMLMLAYIIALLAAVALPAYQDYSVKAKLTGSVVASKSARDALGNYYQSKQQTPDSLQALGLTPQLPDGSELLLEPQSMVLTVKTKQGELVFTPTVNDAGQVVWDCRNGEGLKPTQIPANCRSGE